MLEIHQIPALKDNYIYVLKERQSGFTAAIDPSEAKPVLDYLSAKRWKLDTIFNTHHHWDHTGGNLDLKAETFCEILGYEGDSHRIPGIDSFFREGKIAWGDTRLEVLFIPGHTLGHIALWFEQDSALFCGDTLFSLGCGRLFEGTASQMFQSLGRLSRLPPQTRVFCAHEYTLANGVFALTVDPENQALHERMKEVRAKREQNVSTVPSTIEQELKTNPFLRTPNEKAFADLRSRKDNFS